LTGTVHENQAGERYVKLTQTHNIKLFNRALVMYRPWWAQPRSPADCREDCCPGTNVGTILTSPQVRQTCKLEGIANTAGLISADGRTPTTSILRPG
jgi:hypothetical protein